MSDEEISALSDPELIDLIRRLLEETELRMMQKESE
jgi:hypothetical protein